MVIHLQISRTYLDSSSGCNIGTDVRGHEVDSWLHWSYQSETEQEDMHLRISERRIGLQVLD